MARKAGSALKAKSAPEAESGLFDPAVFLATASHGRAKAEYLAGVVIYAQGDSADAVFHIIHGKVKIAVTSGQGREAVVGLFGEKDFFGEGCLIAQPLRLATATAMTDAELLRIEKAEMIRVLHAEPDFAEVFTAHLLTRNSRVEADLVDHLFNSAKGAWPAFFSCLRISARKESRSRSPQRSVRKCLRR